ncbi:unnamed protein product, partial [Timema podura]|nr:unnamed protein product [Timema podura]
MLNVNTMSGNPFMNFFWQSLVELPGFILGKYFSEKLGRRWTHIIAFMSMSVAHIFIILLVNININGELLEKVNDFVYLGRMFCEIGRIYGEIDRQPKAKHDPSSAMETNIQGMYVHEPELDWLLLIMVVVVKFFATISAYTGYLQAMETFPTCVRQTGCALGSSAASIVGTLGPYILYLVS